MRLCIHLMVTGHYPSRVPPFGNLRIKAYLQLPEAYRSLSRPSSAISAMASTLRSYSLDLAKLLSDPPKTIERSNKSNFFPLLLFSTLSCAVFKVRLKFQPISFAFRLTFQFRETSKRYRNYFRSTIKLLLRLFAGYLPVFLRLCFLLEAFLSSDHFRDRTDLGSRIVCSTIRFSLERR